MRRAVEQAINVGQQHHASSARRLRDTGGQTVVIAKTNFFGGHAVIFVDYRHRACPQQAVQRRGDVQIAAAVFKIIQRDQYLRCGQGLTF